MSKKTKKKPPPRVADMKAARLIIDGKTMEIERVDLSPSHGNGEMPPETWEVWK